MNKSLPTPQEVALFLANAAKWAPSADNTQPWQFSWNGHELCAKYFQRSSGFSIHDHAALLSLGAVVENLVQCANALGLMENWTCKVPTEDTPEFFRIPIHPTAPLIFPEVPLPLLNRHTNRLPFLKTPLPDTLINRLHEFEEAEISCRVLEDPSSFNQLAGLVRRASEARFQTREIHEWFTKTLRFTVSEVNTGDGLDIATFGLPPGGKLLLRFISDWSRMALLNSLGGYKLLANLEAASMNKAGAIVAIVGKTTPTSTMLAGRIMERIWIDLNAHGVGVQPYYVLSDQLFRLHNGVVPRKLAMNMTRLESETRDLLRLQTDEGLHILLRVGIPKRSAVKAVRLSTDQIISSRQHR